MNVINFPGHEAFMAAKREISGLKFLVFVKKSTPFRGVKMKTRIVKVLGRKYIAYFL